MNSTFRGIPSFVWHLVYSWFYHRTNLTQVHTHVHVQYTHLTRINILNIQSCSVICRHLGRILSFVWGKWKEEIFRGKTWRWSVSRQCGHGHHGGLIALCEIHVCMYICMCLCMYVRKCGHEHRGRLIGFCEIHVCMYVYVYVYMCASAVMNIAADSLLCVRYSAFVCVRISVYVYLYAFKYVCIHAYTHIHAHVYSSSVRPAYIIHPYTHAYMHTYAFACTHTYTYVCTCA